MLRQSIQLNVSSFEIYFQYSCLFRSSLNLWAFYHQERSEKLKLFALNININKYKISQYNCVRRILFRLHSTITGEARLFSSELRRFRRYSQNVSSTYKIISPREHSGTRYTEYGGPLYSTSVRRMSFVRAGWKTGWGLQQLEQLHNSPGLCTLAE